MSGQTKQTQVNLATNNLFEDTTGKIKALIEDLAIEGEKIVLEFREKREEMIKEVQESISIATRKNDSTQKMAGLFLNLTMVKAGPRRSFEMQWRQSVLKNKKWSNHFIKRGGSVDEYKQVLLEDFCDETHIGAIMAIEHKAATLRSSYRILRELLVSMEKIHKPAPRKGMETPPEYELGV